MEGHDRDCVQLASRRNRRQRRNATPPDRHKNSIDLIAKPTSIHQTLFSTDIVPFELISTYLFLNPNFGSTIIPIGPI